MLAFGLEIISKLDSYFLMTVHSIFLDKLTVLCEAKVYFLAFSPLYLLKMLQSLSAIQTSPRRPCTMIVEGVGLKTFTKLLLPKF